MVGQEEVGGGSCCREIVPSIEREERRERERQPPVFRV